VPLQDLPGRDKPTLPRHRDIRHHDLRVERLVGRLERLPGSDNADDLEGWFEEHPDLVRHQGIVFGEENARPALQKSCL
jgi:hypothetical protein